MFVYCKLKLSNNCTVLLTRYAVNDLQCTSNKHNVLVFIGTISNYVSFRPNMGKLLSYKTFYMCATFIIRSDNGKDEECCCIIFVNNHVHLNYSMTQIRQSYR